MGPWGRGGGWPYGPRRMHPPGVSLRLLEPAGTGAKPVAFLSVRTRLVSSPPCFLSAPTGSSARRPPRPPRSQAAGGVQAAQTDVTAALSPKKHQQTGLYFLDDCFVSEQTVHSRLGAPLGSTSPERGVGLGPPASGSCFSLRTEASASLHRVRGPSISSLGPEAACVPGVPLALRVCPPSRAARWWGPRGHACIQECEGLGLALWPGSRRSCVPGTW